MVIVSIGHYDNTYKDFTYNNNKYDISNMFLIYYCKKSHVLVKISYQ